jgi:general secretion pathway protein G
MNKTKSRGFTLLELLVVIGIIGVIVSLAAVAYSSAQRKSRDSRRQSDMKSIQSALEVYYSESSSPSFVYPDTCDDAGSYIKGTWPIDPVDVDDLTYTELCDSDSYYVCSEMEVESKGNSSSLPTNANGTGHAWGVGDYYCVSNLQ